jgi:hypothetical protein
MVVHVFIHVFCRNNWLSILTNQLEKLAQYNISSNIHLSLADQECTTLEKIYNFSLQNEALILYLHLKGTTYKVGEVPKYIDSAHTISKIGYPLLEDGKITSTFMKNITSWRECMEYFCIEKSKDCIALLQKNDVVGIELKPQGVGKWKNFGPHFSGSFWWSKSTHIKTLKAPTSIQNRWESEQWICSNKEGKYKSLYQSNHGKQTEYLHLYNGYRE